MRSGLDCYFRPPGERCGRTQECCINAALALVENGQKAPAQLGKSVAVASARVANINMSICWLSLIGGKGKRWVCKYKNGLHTLVYKPFLEYLPISR